MYGIFMLESKKTKQKPKNPTTSNWFLGLKQTKNFHTAVLRRNIVLKESNTLPFMSLCQGSLLWFLVNFSWKCKKKKWAR